mgnify:CR=1 FL=1
MNQISGISREAPVLIAGPTASGKSALAMEIAARDGRVIVNADASAVGAGLFGMLTGGGLFSGLGGISSIIGLLLQVVLIVVVVRLAMSWWQRRTPGLSRQTGRG